MEACAKKQDVQNTKVVKRLLGKDFPSRQKNLQRLKSMHEDSTEGEEMKRQQRMMIVRDMTKKIRSKGRMDAENRWWVAELLAADCEKAWLHAVWEYTIQKMYEWLEEMRKEDEKRGRWMNVSNAKGQSDDRECGRQCWDPCIRLRSPQHGEEEHRS